MAPYFKAVIPSIVILSLVCSCGSSRISIPSDPPIEIITPSPENLNSFDVRGRQVVYADMDVKDDSDTGQLSDTTDISRSNEQDYLEEHGVGNNPVPPDMTVLDICLYTSLMNVNCRASDTIESPVIAILMGGEQATLLSLNPPYTHGKFELVNMSQCWIPLGLMNGPVDPINMCQVSVEEAPQPKVSPQNIPKTKACSSELGKNACLAAGGKWGGGGASAEYCDCN